MSLNQMFVAVIEAWEKISPKIIKRSFVVVGQVPFVDINKINCFKPGKVCAKELEILENLLKLNINQVDLENLCQMDPNSFQQVERIMEEQMGDGLVTFYLFVTNLKK